VNKFSILGGGALVAASASMSLFGTGVAAAAPDVEGQTYADAVTAIEDEGGTAVVAVTVGARMSQDDCIVTNAWDTPFVRDLVYADTAFAHADSEVMLALNCNGGYATASNPGASIASAAGREAKAAAAEEAAAAQSEEQELATADELPGVPGQDQSSPPG
jgi:hypothetical protein